MDIEAEATHSYVRAAPGRIFMRLARMTPDDVLVRAMHIEFTPAQALELSRHLDECARLAIATERAVADGDLFRTDKPTV